MVSINRSFIYGICFASITWLISLYLYINLTSDSLTTTPESLISTKIQSKNSVNTAFDNDLKKYQDFYMKKKFKSKLNEQSQPIFKRPRVSEDEGMNSQLNDLGLVRSVEDQELKDQGYKKFAYNILISNQLSYHREIPDTRNALCKNVSYSLDELPKASIIICFYNEHYHTLLRTIHSILDRTPPKLLKEIVLIDDFSDLDNIHSDIELYIIKNLDSKVVKLFKTERREGLIRARLYGARKSQGDVIVFLDSHVEVNVDWLQPLLSRIKVNRTNVVMPIIDIINADTFVYTSSPLVRGGFNWGLHFKWENLPKGTLSKKEDFIKPIKSPTMAGGLFAMDRKYFTELGEYDAGMNIWGGENLEISFRIWMCGGHLELIPCSKVGHIFRQRRPYGSPDGQDTMLHNSLRVAHVWMDSYKDYFLEQRGDKKVPDFGDISSRLQLRKELKCYDFDWYLKNIYPELTLPSDNQERLKKKWAALENDKYQPWHSRKRNYSDRYHLRLSNSSLCLQSGKDIMSKGSGLVVKKCIAGKNQMWFETDKHELVLAQILCLQASKSAPILYKCHEMGADQEWKHKGENDSPIYNLAAGTCLGVESRAHNSPAIMRLCSDPNPLITWDIIK